jgi:hypothetical protein
MTGAEHYRESERLLESARTWPVDNPARADQLAAAQVHAQLANAGATMAQVFALQAAHGLPSTPAVEQWARAMAPGK